MAAPAGWVAVGSVWGADNAPNAVPAAWTSTDGSSWSRALAETATGDPYGEMTLVAATAGGLFAAGTGGFPADGVIWRSTDGTSWQVIGSGPLFELGCWEGCARFTSIAVGPKGVVVAGYRVAATTETDVWTSADGSAWTRTPLPGAAPGERVASEVSVAAKGDGFLATGALCARDGASCRAVTWSSSDGATWTSPIALPAGAGATGMKVVSGPTADVILGQRCADSCQYTAWASTNATDWLVADLTDRKVTAIWPGLLTAAGSGFLLLGGTGGKVEIWTSVNGVAWHQETLVGSPFAPLGQLLLMDVAGRPDGAIVVGLGPAEAPTVWVSP